MVRQQECRQWVQPCRNDFQKACSTTVSKSSWFCMGCWLLRQFCYLEICLKFVLIFALTHYSLVNILRGATLLRVVCICIDNELYFVLNWALWNTMVSKCRFRKEVSYGVEDWVMIANCGVNRHVSLLILCSVASHSTLSCNVKSFSVFSFS